MSSLTLLCFGILIGPVIAPDHNPFLDLECVDCSAGCGVRSMGASCLALGGGHSKSLNMTIGRSSMDQYVHLYKCIPRDVYIKEKNPDFCCTWSPEIGCQMIKRRSGSQRSCDSCQTLTQNTPEMELCPCKAAYGRLLNRFLPPIIIIVLWGIRMLQAIELGILPLWVDS